MIIFRLLKSRFTSTITTLIITLLISACSTEDLLTAVAPGNDSSSTTENENNITLAWAAPAERENNDPISLSEIAGYKIYYGTAPGQYTNSVTINDGSAIDYTFQNFTAGSYYFVVTTVDTEGRESQFSSAVMITI